MSYPLGLDDVTSVRKLYCFFRRCLRRGHWQLALSCLPQLYQGPQAAETEEMVTGLVTAPHLLSFNEGHTPQQLSWFWLDALGTWFGWHTQQMSTFLKDEATFLLFLEELKCGTSEQVLKELYEAFLYSHWEKKEYRSETSFPQLGPKTISYLRLVLSQNPRLAQDILGFLLVDDGPAAALQYNHCVLNISVNFILHLLTSLEDLQQSDKSNAHLVKQTAEQIYSILCTMHFNVEQQSTGLKHLCEELFRVCRSKGSILKEDRVQGCMLRKNNSGLIGLYGSVASEKLKTQVLALKSPEQGAADELSSSERAILALFGNPEQSDLWKTVYFYCHSIGKHFLEQILLTALALIKKEAFHSLQLLVKEFKPLRRLLVLLGWSHCQSLESARSLLRVLHQNKDLCNDLVLKDFCDGLLFQVEALTWCTEHSSQSIPNKVLLGHLNSLDCHSALYILHHLTNLAEVDEEHVLELLQREPSTGKGGDVSFSHLETDILVPQRNTVVFQAFCAMKCAIYALSINKQLQCNSCQPKFPDGSIDDGETLNILQKECFLTQDASNLFTHYLTKCQHYLQLLPAPLKLELLENIFSLLFVSLTDLKTESSQPEGCAVATDKDELGQKVDRPGSLDSSLEMEDASGILYPIKMIPLSDNSMNTTEFTNIYEGSDVEGPGRISCGSPRHNYLDLKHFNKELSGFLVDEPVLDTFLKMLKDNVDKLKDFSQLGGCGPTEQLKLFECLNISTLNEVFSSRILQLSKYVSEAQWRYKVVLSNQNAGEREIILNATTLTKAFLNVSVIGVLFIFKLYYVLSNEVSTSGSSSSNISAPCPTGGVIKAKEQNHLIPMILSPPESLLISCILRGNYIEAHQVALMFNLQLSASYSELIFMESYHEVVLELSKVEQKIENQASETNVRNLCDSRSTLKAIGNAAAAGMVFYSISDVMDKLLSPTEGQISTLQDDFWTKSAHFEKSDPRRYVVEVLNPSAMVTFDLACTQARHWKTCKQLFETAERKLNNHWETKGWKADSVPDHPEGIRGLPLVLQQMSKIITYSCPSQGQKELEDKINSLFKSSITEMFHTCYAVMNDEYIVREITLDHELEQILLRLKAAIHFHEAKGNLLQALMDQASMKTQDVQLHPVCQEMMLLLKNLEERERLLAYQIHKSDYVRCFFTYMDTLAKVVVQSINTDLDPSVDVKVANPFILLQQKPPQLISHLLFEKQVPPDRLSSLLEKENIGLNVEQVIVNCCCDPLLFWTTMKPIQAQVLLCRIRQSALQCVNIFLPDTDIPISCCTQDIDTSLPSESASLASDSNQHFFTTSTLNFLKSNSNLTAALACLTAARNRKPPKSGLSWIELRSNRKESPLEMEHITKECDLLLSDFPVLQRFLSSMSAPFTDNLTDGDECVKSNCGKMQATLLLLGFHTSAAIELIMEVFQKFVSERNWKCVLQILDFCTGEMEDLIEVKDALLCCAAAEEKDGWQYLIAVENPILRSKLALEFLEKWPLEACEEILDYCLCEPTIEESMKLDLHYKVKELEIYRKILSLKEDCAWASWQDLKKDCMNHPQKIISIILESKDYVLCEDWGLFYPIPAEQLTSLHSEHLLHLLQNKDTERSLQLLQSMKDQNIQLEIAEQALLQDPGTFACHFLSEYLLSHFKNILPETRQHVIHDLHMGSKVLLLLPESAHSNYEHLISSPLLLIEQLLMNMNIAWASVAVQTVQQLLAEKEASLSIEDVDHLLCTYAGKALDIPFSFRERKPDALNRIQDSCNQFAESETIPPSSPADTPASSLADWSRFQTPTGPPDKCLRRNKSSPEFVPPEKPPAKTQWIPDGNETFCMVCKNERFTMFNRRHHCRRCGRLVCSSCSMKKMVVEGCRENPARVCDQCYRYFSASSIKPEEDPEHKEATTMLPWEQAVRSGQRQSISARAEKDPRFCLGSAERTLRMIPIKCRPQSDERDRPPLWLCAKSTSTGLQNGENLGVNLADVLKISKTADTQWWLTINEEENDEERNEFYYEQAPSASLCSAILNLHSKSDECGYQLIERCCILSNGLTNPEMDSRLLLDIMKNLLFSAKMIFVKAARSHDLALCDSYSSKVDLLKILVAASYKDIPSLDEIIKPAAVIRLRNRLLEAEYYNLAIEVSTKTGLDPAGVWHAWGMACLKSDNLPVAREKFSRCLKGPLDPNQKNGGSKLLDDVIQHLESAAKPILLVKDDDYFATLKELESTLKTRCIWYEMMPEGKIQNNAYYQECLHYLHSYGTHLNIIQFYMAHDLMREALLHLLNKECPGDIFIEGIFVPCSESGKLHTLENMLETIDPSLQSWSTYLIDVCKYLQQKNFYNILYELQQFMKDHVRAAMTCIHFFSHKAKSYKDLGDNHKWLIRSKDHLKTYLQEVSRSSRKKSFDTFRKKMSASDVSRHINTVELQMEITKFLQRNHTPESSQFSEKPPPTLFGHSNVIIEVACMVILEGKNVEEGFGLAFRVIQDFQLDVTKVCGKVCKHLVQREHYSEIMLLVKCVRESGISVEKDCDDILLRCAEEMVDAPSDEQEALIEEMRTDENKIKALIICHMYRSAYLTAVQLEPERAVQIVQEVSQAAYEWKDMLVHRICEKWLEEHPLKSKAFHKHSSRK
ncbi:LOW QUALITY PROTEIN: zinc finger FYVE domain-containing protein 26 [Pelodytes ibericus]